MPTQAQVKKIVKNRLKIASYIGLRFSEIANKVKAEFPATTDAFINLCLEDQIDIKEICLCGDVYKLYKFQNCCSISKEICSKKVTENESQEYSAIDFEKESYEQLKSPISVASKDGIKMDPILKNHELHIDVKDIYVGGDQFKLHSIHTCSHGDINKCPVKEKTSTETDQFKHYSSIVVNKETSHQFQNISMSITEEESEIGQILEDPKLNIQENCENIQICPPEDTNSLVTADKICLKRKACEDENIDVSKVIKKPSYNCIESKQERVGWNESILPTVTDPIPETNNDHLMERAPTDRTNLTLSLVESPFGIQQRKRIINNKENHGISTAEKGHLAKRRAASRHGRFYISLRNTFYLFGIIVLALLAILLVAVIVTVFRFYGFYRHVASYMG